ncbi:hypothetical protein [Umezawaea tangerina]|uniref:Uncharacterized protein n=1 Tax=Umezawaea tangerina TaxID=84725 RepID=A0A2T0T1S9_9PSEU|nr:hypothetical protein [Umezawaea tangerina]PRY39583.1 hypothetical protein CLV43_107166 [Umezawaea tangerina]
MDGTTPTQVGSALTWSGLAAVAGLLVFLLACRLAEGGPLRPRDARRIAAWRRAAPWLLAVSAATAAVGLGLLRFAGP